MGRPRKYQTEEERKAAQREQIKQWKATNKEYFAEYWKNNKEKLRSQQSEYRKNNSEYWADYWVKYRSTQFGRAANILSKYRHADKLKNRGKCTLTADWIVENIFSQPCHYCGRTDWTKMGCDRIDNSLPHTPDNVVPCCWECNNKRGTTSYDDFMKMIGKIA